MSHFPAIWIVALSQLALTLASPIYAPQFLSGGTGRNIRHLPCVSFNTGETGVCMFALTCVKSNGTHLGTCIDRFYFGSCCKLSDDTEIHPQDNTIEDASAVSSFVTAGSIDDSNDIPDYFTRPKPITDKKPEITTLSTIGQTVLTTKQQTRTTTIRPTTITTTTTTRRPTTTTTTRRPTTTTTTRRPTRTTTTATAAAAATSTTTTQKIVTKRPSFFSTPYTTTQPPNGLLTFQTLHDYSHGSGSSATSNHLSISTIRPATFNKNSTSNEATTTKITTISGGSSKPGITATFGTSRPSVYPAITKKPVSASSTKPSITRKPVSSSTTRPIATTRPVATTTTSLTMSTTTERTSTRFPPRNSTTTRPLHTTNKRKPINHNTKKPAVTTERPITKTQRPIETKKPTVVSTTRPTISTTEKMFSTSVRVTQTYRPISLTSTQETPTNLATKPSNSTSSNEAKPSQRPNTERPVTTSITEKIITTTSPTTIRPVTTSKRPRPSSKPTKISTSSFTTFKTTPRPQQTSTENIEQSTSSLITSTLSTFTSTRPLMTKPTLPATVRPKPAEKPEKPSKPTIPLSTMVENFSTTTATTQASGNSTIHAILNETTLANEILPPKVTGSIATTEKIVQTTQPSGLVTWSSNSDDDVTKSPEITTSFITETTQEASNEPEWSPITTPDGWIMIQSPMTEKIPINAGDTTKPETTKIPTSSVKPSSSESSTTERTTTARPTVTTLLSTIATVTTATDLPVPMETLNMTDYNQVCGRRLFPESRIVGGDHSSFGKWPWQISLRQWRTAAYLHKCGAALLNENWAITAAHCVENVPPSDLLLRIGEHDLANEDEPYGFQERRVQIVASHPQFDPRTFEYDLALLRFYEPVLPFQPNLLPICLPDDDENYVGHTAYVTGWGRLYEDGPLPSVLQEVSVPVVNNTVCEGMYRNAGYIEHIPHIFICAGWRKGGFDSCEGDSGGPMVIQRPRDKRWILAGVISWGIGCAEPNQPGVYTRISEFREWINQILQF